VLRRRRRLVSSALARAEVPRALLSLEPRALQHGDSVLARVDLVRINDAHGSTHRARTRTVRWTRSSKRRWPFPTSSHSRAFKRRSTPASRMTRRTAFRRSPRRRSSCPPSSTSACRRASVDPSPQQSRTRASRSCQARRTSPSGDTRGMGRARRRILAGGWITALKSGTQQSNAEGAADISFIFEDIGELNGRVDEALTEGLCNGLGASSLPRAPKKRRGRWSPRARRQGAARGGQPSPPPRAKTPGDRAPSDHRKPRWR
jgi:hypothetical protein